MARRERLAYLDVLRVLATVAVVLLHVAAARFAGLQVDSSAWAAVNLYDSATRFAVPVFFLISGALFLDPSASVTVSSVWRKSLPRLVVAWVAWSLFYAWWVTRDGPHRGRGFLETVPNAYYHLWFLPALAGCYVLAPILRRVVTDRAIAWYLVGIGAALSVLDVLVRLIGSETLGALPDRMWLGSFGGYAFVFVAGYLLATSSRRPRAWGMYAVAALCLLDIAILTWAESMARGRLVVAWYEHLAPVTVLSGMALFLALRSHIPGSSLGGWDRLVTWLGSISFGVYLVHPFVLDVVSDLVPSLTSPHPVLSVPLTYAVVLAVSVAISWVISRVPVVGRYLA